MKNYIHSIAILIPCFIFGQVGIKTTNPQQGLHVGGGTSTVKVDGLSYPTNPNNLGPGNVSRVFVDANGDLVLGTAQNNIAILFDAENYIKDDRDPSINQVFNTVMATGLIMPVFPETFPIQLLR